MCSISSNIAHIRNVKDSVLDLTVVRNIFLWVFPMIGVKIFLFFRHTVSVRHVDHVVLALFRRSVEHAVGIIRDLAVAYFKTCIGTGGFLRLIALVKTSPKGKRRVRARFSARMCLCGRCDSCLLRVDVPARCGAELSFDVLSRSVGIICAEGSYISVNRNGGVYTSMSASSDP